MFAKNAFYEWSEFWGFNTTKSIVNLLKNEHNVMELVDMLSMFVLQVVKNYCKLYLPINYTSLYSITHNFVLFCCFLNVVEVEYVVFQLKFILKKSTFFLLPFYSIVIDHAFVCKWFCKWHKFMIFDVIDIFRQLTCHHSLEWPPSKACPYFMFLHLKPNWQQFHDNLFTTTRMGWNQLCLIVDKLMMTFHDLKTNFFFNKINKGIGIMHMEEAFVPKEYGMEMINHRDLICYRKYVFSLELSILVKLFWFTTKLHLLVFLFMHLLNFLVGIVYGMCLLHAISTMQW